MPGTINLTNPHGLGGTWGEATTVALLNRHLANLSSNLYMYIMNFSPCWTLLFCLIPLLLLLKTFFQKMREKLAQFRVSCMCIGGGAGYWSMSNALGATPLKKETPPSANHH